MGMDGDATMLIVGQGLYSPSWSPDGTEIAYIRDSSIHIVSTDGGESRVILGPWDSIQDLDWSPSLDTETAIHPATWGQVKLQ